MQIDHWLGMIVSFMLVGRCVSQDLDAPQFSQSFYEITVAENIKIGLTLFTVSITNKDPGDIKFTLNDTTNFIITRSGAVEYYGGLDYEKPELRQITLIITATDSRSPPKSTSVPVYINLTNINDESPRCVKQMYQGEVLNGAPAGTEVLQVLAVDRDFNTTLIYNLTLPNAYFEINRQTGVITTSRVVDIAAILEGKFETFRVRVSDGLRNNLCPVMLTIKDPNFHDPKFSKTVYESSLDEGSPAQRVSVLTVTATDEDIGAQKILTYSLTPTMYSDNFEIDSSSGEIWLVGSIDRENMTSPTTVTLIVEAVDSGLPPATASATVNIVINDVDDNGPKFSTDYYEFNMLKKFSRDLKITSLPKAVDADLGENAIVSYDLSAEGLMVFDIDKSTGDITTKISCSQTCILSSNTQFEFRLFAYNEADPSIDGDSISVRTRLVETLPSTALPSITTQKQDGTTQKPGGSTQKPGDTTQKPGGTTQKPGGTTQKPGGTTKKPGDTTQKADGTTQKSGATTQKPGATTQKPGDTTQRLGGTTQKPSGTTKKPGDTTQKADGTTQKPGGTTQKPDATTQKPGDTTQRSGGTTQKPGGTTQKLGGTTQKADGTTQKSGGTTQKPGDMTQRPGGTTQKPGGTTQKPGGTTQKPGKSTKKPDGTTQKPGETTQKPGGTTQKPGGTTQKPGGSTQKPGDTTQKPGGTTQKPGGTTQRPGDTTQRPGGTTKKPGDTTQKPGGTTQKSGGSTQKPGDTTQKPGDTTQKPGDTTQKPDDKGPKFSSDLYEFDMVKNFPGNLKITLLPKAVDSDENAVVFYNLSVEGLTVFDINKSTGDITTKISCSQACILTNSTQFEFHLMAYNEADPSTEGDSILIRIRLVERITPPALPGGNKPTTNVLPARGGTSEEPVLSVEEVVAIVVVVCLFLFIVFVIILVLLLRRGSTQRKKDRIDFNPSHHAVRKIENEVP